MCGVECLLNGVRIGLSENEGRAENGRLALPAIRFPTALRSMGTAQWVPYLYQDSLRRFHSKYVIYALDKHRTPVRLIDEYHMIAEIFYGLPLAR